MYVITQKFFSECNFENRLIPRSLGWRGMGGSGSRGLKNTNLNHRPWNQFLLLLSYWEPVIRENEIFSCTQIALFSTKSQKNNMFSCDLRLDYLIFSLWCPATSKHLLNGQNRHDYSVYSPGLSRFLVLHVLPGSVHPLPWLPADGPTSVSSSGLSLELQTPF